MSEIVNTAEIRIVADASGVEAGMRPAVDAAQRASQAISQTGASAIGASRNVEAAQRNIIAAIQRTTMAMEAGGRTTAAFYEAQARARNVDPTSLTPYLNQLRAVEAAQTQAAEATRNQAAASRELAQAQANKESFLAGLREQVALFGRSTEEVLRYRAAQAGAAQEASHLILQLQNMRAAHEQVEAAARASAQAQREAAQADANRNAFLQGLREQIALFGLSTEEVHRYRAAQLGAAQSAEPLIAQLRDLRLAQEQAAYGARMEAQAQREAAQARATQTSFLKSLEQQAASIGKTRLEMLELQAAQMGVTAQARPFIEQLRAAEQGMRNNGMSAAQMNAALRGVPAQMTDIIVSLQGGQAPLTVLLQQGGQLRDMFGSVGGAARALGGAVLGLINPYTIVAATVGVGVAAFKAGHDESIRYSRALALTNNMAGTTSQQMADMANNIGLITGSQREGAKALTTLASTGAITRENLQWFGTVAVDAQHVLGKSVEDTAKEFAELGKSPLSALQSINDKYHFITAATYAQVKAAQEQGRTIEAASIAQQAYADGIQKQKQQVLDSLTDWERGWLRIKKAISESVDGVIDFATGREKGPEQKIKALLDERKAMEARVARLKEAGANREGDEYDPARDRQVQVAQAQLDANLREINSIRDKAAAKRTAADAQATENRANDLRNKWLSERNILLTRSEQLTRDLEAAETEGRQNKLSEKEILDRQMVIRRKYNDVFVDGIDRSITALRRRGELEEVLGRGALAQIEAQREAGLISEDEAIKRTAAEHLAQIDKQKASVESELALASKKIGSRREQIDLEGRLAKLSAERGLLEQQLETDLEAAKRKRAEASDENYNKGILAAQAELDSLMQLVDAQVLSNAEIGLSKVEVADMASKRLLAAAASREEAAAIQATLPGGEQLAEIYRKQAAELRGLAAAKQSGAAREETVDVDRKALDELNRFLDPTRAQTFGEALREAFGAGGEALSKLMGTLDGYGRREAEIAKHRETAEKNRGKGGADEVKYLKTMAELSEREIKNRLQGYGDMAGAAKGFFSEGSKGYMALEGAERAFRVMELASQMQSLYTHLFVTTTKATATTAGQAVETGAVVAGEAARNVAKVPGVFMSFMSAMGPWGMAAAAAAIAAVLGGAFSGGGGMNLTESRQKSQGTGTVLGSDAKSESISKSLDMIESASFQGLGISTQMLDSLRNIESGIGAFAAQLVGSTSIGKVNVGPLNSNNGGATTGFGIAAGAAIGSYFGPIGTAIGAFVGLLAKNIPIIGKIATSIFGGKQSVQDTGLSIGRTDFATILAGGLDAMKYADIKTDGGWFKKDKYSTKSEDLGSEAQRQISSILASLYDSVFEAGKLLGIGADDFATKLNGFVVDIGEVSLKGLSGEEIEKELAAVFSKVGDQLAQFGVAGLQQFQKVGEGYLETLTRVATNYQAVTVVTDSLGMAFKAVGQGSIEARERLVELSGGLDKFTSAAEDFFSDFFSEQEQADALRARLKPTLDQFGIQTGADDSMQQFRDVVKSLKLETAEGAKAFATLMDIAPAFKQVADFDKARFEELAEANKSYQDQIDEILKGRMTAEQVRAMEIVGMDASTVALYDRLAALTKEKEVAEERKGLQDQLDDLTLSATEKLHKQRAALDDSSHALFDQIQAAKAHKEATEKASQAIKDAQASAKAFGDAIMGSIERAERAAQALRDFNDALLLGNLSTLDPDAKYREAKKQFEAAGADDTQAMQAFLQASKDRGADSFYYERDFAAVQAKLAAGIKAAEARPAALAALYRDMASWMNPTYTPPVAQPAPPAVVTVGYGSMSGRSAPQSDVSRLEAKVDSLAEAIGDNLQVIAESTSSTARYIGKGTNKGNTW